MTILFFSFHQFQCFSFNSCHYSWQSALHLPLPWLKLPKITKNVFRCAPFSSLHSIISNSFGLFFLLWSLLAQARLSICVVIVVQKSYYTFYSLQSAICNLQSRNKIFHNPQSTICNLQSKNKFYHSYQLTSVLVQT